MENMTNIYPQATNIDPILKIFIFQGKYLSFQKISYPQGINIYLIWTIFFFMRKLFIQERQYISSEEKIFSREFNFVSS
jgi:hypothetical protein